MPTRLATREVPIAADENIVSKDKAVYLHNQSFVDNVKGDEPGKGGGVVSQVGVKISHDVDHSKRCLRQRQTANGLCASLAKCD